MKRRLTTQGSLTETTKEPYHTINFYVDERKMKERSEGYINTVYYLMAEKVRVEFEVFMFRKRSPLTYYKKGKDNDDCLKRADMTT